MALLSTDTQRQLASLLAELSAELGDAAWVMPAEALHITLCEIVQFKDYSQDPQKIYEQHSTEYIHRTADIMAKYDPITISFDLLHVSPQAIIIKGTDNGSFNQIRKEQVDLLPLPAETKMPPDIIHSSIARFVKEVPLEDVERIVKKHSINIQETVSEFKLIHGLVSPLLKYEVIQSYPLVE